MKSRIGTVGQGSQDIITPPKLSLNVSQPSPSRSGSSSDASSKTTPRPPMRLPPIGIRSKGDVDTLHRPASSTPSKTNTVTAVLNAALTGIAIGPDGAKLAIDVLRFNSALQSVRSA